MLLTLFYRFLSHKKAIAVVALTSLLSGVIELSTVNFSPGTLDADALNNASVIFFLSNMIGLVVTCWALIGLMYKTASSHLPIKLSSTVFALLKSGFVMVLWSLLLVMLVSAILSTFIPSEDFEAIINGKKSLDLIPQAILITLVGAALGMVYTILMISFAGSLLRRQLKAFPKNVKTGLASWFLPVSSFYYAFFQPYTWSALVCAFAFKATGVFLEIKGLPFATLISEPLTLIAVFFGFYVAYEKYAVMHIDATVNILKKEVAQSE